MKMNNGIYIIGHKNPDTDSIVASLAYAELKQRQGTDAIAARIGDINPETDYLLKRFDAEEPVYIKDARIKLYDIKFDEPLLIRKDDTIKTAWNRLAVKKGSSLYVVDQEQRLIGVVSLSDLTSILLNEGDPRNRDLMQQTPTDNIVKVLEGTYLYQSERYHTNGTVHVLASRKATYSDLNFKGSIVVLSDDLLLQKRVLQDGASCLILVDVDIVSQSIIELAKERQATIISTPMDMFKVARRIYRCPSVGLIMSRKIISFHHHDYIDDAYQLMSKSRYRSYPVLNQQGIVLGSIARYHLLNHAKKQFILVDHNEASQSIDYLDDGEVLEIIDHHRIGDIETTTPVQFRNEIIGSTCSIIAKMFQEYQIIPSQKIAALLCSAIISDTMNFHSPTTTKQDKMIAKTLAKLANIDMEQLAKDMYGAVATLKGKSMSEILYNDFKEYNIDGKRIAIGQINIADEQEIPAIRDEMYQYMKTIHDINKFDLLMMCFTSVDGRGSNLMYVGKLSTIVDEVCKDLVLDDLYFVDGIVSRKKQIIPMLSKGISQR